MNKLPQIALSIRQPWAWLITNGYKPVENRSWHTHVRDRIAVHASQKFDREGWEWVKTNFPHIPLPDPDEFDRGGIVGTVEIIDCVKEMDSPWFSGPWGFVLSDPESISFEPCRGKLGFFKL